MRQNVKVQSAYKTKHFMCFGQKKYSCIDQERAGSNVKSAAKYRIFGSSKITFILKLGQNEFLSKV